MLREYEYDRLGNILDLYHHGGAGNIYHRVFNAGSSNPFEISNLATSISYVSTTINYAFDANGNQISEGSSRSFEWDFGDRMRGFAEGTSVRAAYLYDAGGQRVKKIVRNQQGDSVVTVYIDGGFTHDCLDEAVFVITL
jgi:PKD repeat protein